MPADFTPNVNDGAVFSIARVGSKIILGGTFTSASPTNDASTEYPLANTLAFDATTGALDTTTGYLPVVNGEVDTVIPGPAPDQVYIAGEFTTVDGVAMRVALLSTTTGAIVPTWSPPTLNRQINRLVLANGRLFVGGTFTKVGGADHRGLVALNPKTGKLTSYVNLSFSGHHNYGTKCNPAKVTCAAGETGVKAIDVSPDGTRLVAIGDFTTVSGVHRDQLAMIDLGASAATVDPNWATLAYTAACFSQSFDSDVRDVQFAPDGRYLVVAATGGTGTNSDGTKSSCDAASRFDTGDKGSNIRPTWIDYTGADSLWSVAITGSVVYVGGHQRWMNNSLGRNDAGQGAIARPGIAALSPSSGLPLAWNPGRDPRGAGCFALLATADGLWIGSDTDYIGNRLYFHQKVAFFPLAGGAPIPNESTPRLPGRVYLAGAPPAAADPDRFAYREFNGAAVGQVMPIGTGISWGAVDGAFTVGGQVIYGKPDGNLYERSFDGSTFGSEVELTPFDDPTWDSVQTGSGQTYQSSPSTFSAEIPSVTSMFFTAGRLYYTLAGKAKMRWRWFEPDSGVVGAEEFTAPGSMDWSKVAGAFLSRSVLFYADATTGQLRSVAWSMTAGPTGSSTLVNASTGWASRGMFALSQSTNPTPTPVADFTGGCGSSATCAFDATPWADPDGGIVRYEWSFGDGTTAPLSTSTSVSHHYTTEGDHTVTLTVMSTAGATAVATGLFTIAAPIEKVAFVGSASGVGSGKTTHVVVPKKARAGDALVLFDSFASTRAKLTTPHGWKLVAITHRRALTTAVFDKIAGSHAARGRVTVKYSRSVHSSAILTVYSHTSSRPIEASTFAVGRATRVHPAPALSQLSTGSWVVGFWTQRSKKVSAWTLPPSLKRRGGAHSAGRPADGAVVADLGLACQGTCRLGSARSKRLSTAAAQWAIALAPALR